MTENYPDQFERGTASYCGIVVGYQRVMESVYYWDIEDVRFENIKKTSWNDFLQSMSPSR